MHVRYDRAGNSIVLVCACGYQDVGTSQAAAWSLAADHERRAHPADWSVRNAATQRTSYAKKSSTGEA